MQKTRRIISLMATFVMAMMIFVGCSSKPTTMQEEKEMNSMFLHKLTL